MTHDHKQEERIKNRLCNIDLEESHLYALPRPAIRQPLRKKHSDLPELSDWTNHFELPQAALPPDPARRLTFYSTARYPSSLLQERKNSRLELSPIVVKFNARVLSQNLQKSKEKYMRRLREDPYLTHYESSSLVHQRRTQLQLRTGRGPQVKEIRFEGVQDQAQRMTGLLKLLRKDNRTSASRHLNPERKH